MKNIWLSEIVITDFFGEEFHWSNLGQVNILVGDNNSGKTIALDCIWEQNKVDGVYKEQQRNEWSGEHNLYSLIESVKEKEIVFIDLIELHLDIDNQRTIVDRLLGVNPNVQLFITTHSPFVIQGLNTRQIKTSICKIQNGESEIYRSDLFNLYCMDIDTISRVLFGNPLYPKSINDNIEEYNALLERLKNNEGKINPTLFTEIENKHKDLVQYLDSAHPVLLRGQMIINLKNQNP